MMDCNVFFSFLISGCLSFILQLYAFFECLDLIADIGLLFVVRNGTKCATFFSPLCIESDTGYSLNCLANRSPTNMKFYWVQADRYPHFSTDLEGTAITHVFPLLILI